MGDMVHLVERLEGGFPPSPDMEPIARSGHGFRHRRTLITQSYPADVRDLVKFVQHRTAAILRFVAQPSTIPCLPQRPSVLRFSPSRTRKPRRQGWTLHFSWEARFLLFYGRLMGSGPVRQLDWKDGMDGYRGEPISAFEAGWRTITSLREIGPDPYMHLFLPKRRIRIQGRRDRTDLILYETAESIECVARLAVDCGLHVLPQRQVKPAAKAEEHGIRTARSSPAA